MKQRPREQVLTLTLVGAGIILALGFGCSKVDAGSGDSEKNMTIGSRDCIIFPGAQAWDENTQQWRDLELIEFPEYCWCEADDSTVSPELLDQLEENALGHCIWTAIYLGYDPTQTNCIDVMIGPVEGGFDGNTACMLYGGEDFSLFGEGETGDDQAAEPAEPYLSAYRPVTDADASSIDWSGGGTPEFVPLDCDLNLDCCELFDTDICRYTDPAYPMPGGRADWTVADASTNIDIAYQGCQVTPGPELVLDGRADYSLADCDGARCPVYLAALELELPAGGSGRLSTALLDGRCADKTIERFEIRLVHAALGSHDPLGSRLAFPVGSLVFETSVDISAEPGEFGAGEYHFLAFNDRVVWGRASEDGGLSFEPESLSFHELGFDLGVAFEAAVLGSPPQVEVELPEALECDEGGLATVELLGSASDVDDDLLSAYWLLGEDLVLADTVQLPIGSHALTYRAVDRRGASTTREVVVRVEDTGAPALSVERSQAAAGCDGADLVTLAVPTSVEACTPDEVVVAGQVVSRDGEPLEVPLDIAADGSVVLEPGQYTLEWTATDAAGNRAVEKQLLSCRP